MITLLNFVVIFTNLTSDFKQREHEKVVKAFHECISTLFIIGNKGSFLFLMFMRFNISWAMKPFPACQSPASIKIKMGRLICDRQNCDALTRVYKML